MTESPFDVTVEVGTVLDAEDFPETRKEHMYKLWIDLGDEDRSSAGSSGTRNTGGVSASHEPRSGSESTDAERSVRDGTVQSAAQLGAHHEPDDIVGQQVLCATSLGTVNIAGFESEVLTLGVPGDDGYPVLVTPTEQVPNGGGLY